MQQICIIKTSLATQQDARELANGLIAARLASCVQITGPGESVYRWQGVIEQTKEWYLNIKTSIGKQPEVVDWLLQQHPYDVPEIVCSVWNSTDAYADWLIDEVKPNDS